MVTLGQVQFYSLLHLSIRTKLAAAFGGALLLLAATGAYEWSSTVNLVDNAQMVDHTHEVIGGLERIMSRLKDAETGQRGFVITGEPHYLEPYDIGLAEVERELKHVRALTSDNPFQQRKLDLFIEPLIQLKLRELSDTINLRRTRGFEGALGVIRRDSGKQIMDALRTQVAIMQDRERRLLEQRAAATASTATKTKLAVIFGSIMSTGIFGIIALFLYRTNSKLGSEVEERKRAEAGLKQTMAELSRSNQELEQFSHIASHDLQEPLRMVSSYTQLLERRYKDKLDSEANEFIAYAVDGAKRMQTQINDLLAYSRVTTQGNSFETTNCSDIFENVLTNLAAVIEESGAIVTRDSLPTVPADASQLVSVFQNLIGNSIKYHGDQPPLIHVSAVESGDEWLFSFKDNGIGVESEYAERVFVIFQRLHGKTKYAGTGVGLAICKKVIERHGGRIWVESEPQKGSTFYFTLPKRNQQEEEHEVPGHYENQTNRDLVSGRQSR